MIFDTHAHYDDEAFNDDRDAVLQRLEAAGIGRDVNCGADLASSKRSVELAGKNGFIYAAVGVHPDNAGEIVSDSGEVLGLDELRKLAKDPKVVAVGEIGLDYHWNIYPAEVQKQAFIRQWELAVELGLPIEIHSRDAAEDTMTIVRGMFESEKRAGRELRADMHCYSYSPDQAAEYVRMGLYFGIGGVLTFKNAKKLRQVVDLIPVDRILLETDCPYLAPEPHRGQRNNSAYLPGVVAEIANIKGLTGEQVEDITNENACRFFGLDRA